MPIIVDMLPAFASQSLHLKRSKRSSRSRAMQSFSPRQLARAAGVSESSVKRWCDQGLIPTQKTAGGHRRLADAASEFLRHSHPDARFELLGLPPRPAKGLWLPTISIALISGSEDMCRQIVFDLHYRGERASRIFDTVIAPAFVCVGQGWECNKDEVFQERPRLRHLPASAGRAQVNDSAAQKHRALALARCGMRPIHAAHQHGRDRSAAIRLASAIARIAAVRDFARGHSAVKAANALAEHLSPGRRRALLASYRDFYAEAGTEVPIVVGGRH